MKEYHIIQFSEDEYKQINRTQFTLLQVGEELPAERSSNIENEIREYVLLLPHLDQAVAIAPNDENDFHQYYYYVVNNEWKERWHADGKTTWELPMVENVSYE